MRIHDLFDELSAAEQEELLSLPLREHPTVSTRRIRRRVNAALDRDPSARRQHHRRIVQRAVCAAAIAALLLTGAVAAVRTGLLSDWLPDGIGDLMLNTTPQSIGNGDLRLTLEESLSDINVTYLAYSLTAQTPQGQALLDALRDSETSDTANIDRIPFPVEIGYEETKSGVTQRGPYASGLITESRAAAQPDVLRFSSYLYGVSRVYLTLDGADGRLEVPLTPNAQNAEILFDSAVVPLPNGTEATFYSLRLTSLGYTLDVQSPQSDDQDFSPDYLLAFWMRDGSIRTLGQLIAEKRRWSEVLDLKTVKAVILNDTAYYLNGRRPSSHPLPDRLRPICLHPVEIGRIYATDGSSVPLPGVSARALLTPFGGSIEWDPDTQTAILTLEDHRCTVTAGRPVVQFGNGQSMTLPYPYAAIWQDGELYLSLFGYNRTLGIQTCGIDYAPGGWSYRVQHLPQAVYYIR